MWAEGIMECDRLCDWDSCWPRMRFQLTSFQAALIKWKDYNPKMFAVAGATHWMASHWMFYSVWTDLMYLYITRSQSFWHICSLFASFVWFWKSIILNERISVWFWNYNPWIIESLWIWRFIISKSQNIFVTLENYLWITKCLWDFRDQ